MEFFVRFLRLMNQNSCRLQSQDLLRLKEEIQNRLVIYFLLQLIIQIKTNHCCRFLASSVILFTEKEKAKLFQNYVTGEYTKPIKFPTAKKQLFLSIQYIFIYFRSALLSVVSHSLSAYITTLESVPLQRLSSRDQMEIKK